LSIIARLGRAGCGETDEKSGGGEKKAAIGASNSHCPEFPF
jgi:hypothetical protein